VTDTVAPTSEQARDLVVGWLLESEEPWTRYRTLVDLLDRPEDDPRVLEARAEMLAHPQVKELVAGLSTWGEHPAILNLGYRLTSE